MPYVDGYVLPGPKKNLESYRRLAEKAGKIWREHGALEFREFVMVNRAHATQAHMLGDVMTNALLPGTRR
jgi:uncharacterized protein YbaA (DUF1428 family)